MKTIDYLIFQLIMFFRWLAARLPEQAMYRVAYRLGRLSYYFLGSRRSLALSNLELALGDQTTPARRVEILRESLVHLAYTFVELMHMDKIMADWENRFEFEGDRAIDEAIGRKQGFFVFGGHLGGWTMIKSFALRFRIPGNVIIRPQRNPYLDQWLRNYVAFQGQGGRMIHTRGTGDLIERLIQNGEMVGMFMDQESRRAQGVFVRFFGQPANSLVVPAHLVRKHRIPMFPYWIPRTSPGHFKNIFLEPIPILDTGDSEADLKAMTQTIVSEVERAIRQYPEQWLWLHSRWKRRPEDYASPESAQPGPVQGSKENPPEAKP